jgi:Pilus formation protein N terminal region
MLSHRQQPTKRTALSLPAAVAMVIAVLAGTLAMGGEAQASDLIVRYDQTQLIRLPRRATEVIVGNPSIADVAIQGGNLIAVTGKSFGVTNIIALDEKSNVIQDQRLIVERDNSRMLVLYKGPLRESYTCTPDCSPTITIGDDTAYFESIAKHTQRKFGVSTGAADRSDANAQQ